MTTVILLNSSPLAEQWLSLIERANSENEHLNWVAVSGASDISCNSNGKVTLLSCDKDGRRFALNEIGLGGSDGERSGPFLLIDTDIVPPDGEVLALLQRSDGIEFSDPVLIPARIGGVESTNGPGTVEEVQEMLCSGAPWPLTVIITPTLNFTEEEWLGNDYTDVFLTIILKSLCDNANCGERRLQQGWGSITIPTESLAKLHLDSTKSASILKYIVEHSPIEKVFKRRNLESATKEVLSDCYHLLAALFLRFGDLQSASDCVALGDCFKPGPRALALKGLISVERGESLGAVADLVSSLQEYEEQKKAGGSLETALIVLPSNLDAVNSNLVAGLNALNKRDNQGAAQHFADAVFDFDSFFYNCGLSRTSNRDQVC